MGVRDLDEYEDMDGYEDEGEDQEEEDGEDEEEEEDRMPSQEELEYLDLRQKLKESIRRKMKTDSCSGLANSMEKKNQMPYDNFGSFFGPSQPVIAQRVIQESKSLLENPHLVARVSKAKNGQIKGGASTAVLSKPRANEQPREIQNWSKPKAKIQMLKDTRDYSFLLSDDAELPAPTKNPPKSVSTSKPGTHLSQKTPGNTGRKFINGRDERKLVPAFSQMRIKAGPQSQKPSSVGKTNAASLESRKQLGRDYGSGPGRPSGPKPLLPKVPVASKEKVISGSVAKGSVPGVRKPVQSKFLPVPKKPLEQKKDDRASSMGNMTTKKPVAKPQIKQRPAKLPPRVEQPKRKPASSYSDDEADEAINMIRNLFRYNPNKYDGVDDDDRDMVTNFKDQLKEERRSAIAAAREDEEELRKIEEEERRKQMRKEAKRRKLSQR